MPLVHHLGALLSIAAWAHRQRDAPVVQRNERLGSPCTATAMVANVMLAGSIIDRVSSLYRRGASERELVDLNGIVREMSLLLSDTANRNAVSIRTELDPGLPPTTADRVQLQQVLMNLMLNGIEAMQDTVGELTVASKRTEDGLLISVSDTGIGLSIDEAKESHDEKTRRSSFNPARGAAPTLIPEPPVIEAWCNPGMGRGHLTGEQGLEQERR